MIRWSIFDESPYYQVVDQAAGEQAALVEAVKQLGVLVKSITSTGEACLQVVDLLLKKFYRSLSSNSLKHCAPPLPKHEPVITSSSESSLYAGLHNQLIYELNCGYH